MILVAGPASATNNPSDSMSVTPTLRGSRVNAPNRGQYCTPIQNQFSAPTCINAEQLLNGGRVDAFSPLSRRLRGGHRYRTAA
jgi:hypothetical protein